MEALIVFIVFGSVFGTILGFRSMSHRERIAELELKRVEALAEMESRHALSPGEAPTGQLTAGHDEPLD